jgi:hypothetical protein
MSGNTLTTALSNLKELKDSTGLENKVSLVEDMGNKSIHDKHD